MNAVYQISQDFQNFQYFSLVDEAQHYGQLTTHVAKKNKHWIAPKISIAKSISKLRKGDLWNFGGSGALIISSRAADELRDYLSDAAELLPIDYLGERFWAVNVLALCDCFDLEKTTVEYFDEAKDEFATGTIADAHRAGQIENMTIQRPCFDPRKFGAAVIFRVPQNTAYTYVRQEFKTAAESASLLGFRFKLVWQC